MRTPDYWPRACAELAAADHQLGELMTRYAGEGLSSHGDSFVTLARAIVGQQISVRAADAVWLRLEQGLTGTPRTTPLDGSADTVGLTPTLILKTDGAALRACGLSWRKVDYLRDLAQHFADGRLGPQVFAGADDAELLQRLTAVRGIGRWSAEMFLIFHLLRPDVLPLDDIGLLRAVGLLYGDGSPADADTTRQIAERWAPWRTVATWYLWRALDPVPVAY